MSENRVKESSNRVTFTMTNISWEVCSCVTHCMCHFPQDKPRRSTEALDLALLNIKLFKKEVKCKAFVSILYWPPTYP